MAKLGASPGWSSQRAETLTAATTFTRQDSGKVFYVTTTTTFANILPKCSDAGPGWEITFVAGANLAATITFTSAQNSDAMYGNTIPADGNAGDSAVTAGTDDRVQFATAAIQGDKIYITTDGSAWYVYGTSAVQNAIAFAGALSG